MKIGVLVKQVPDTETKIRVKADASGIETDGIKYILNPYDEFAIEAALQVKEKQGPAEVVIISMGPARVVESIRTGLAMGGDKGIHIDDTGIAADSSVNARVIANAIKAENFDIIFCGKQGIDGDNSQTVSMVGEFLNIPQVVVVEGFEMRGDKKGAVIKRKVAGGTTEVYDIDFPVILGAEKGLNTPRYASLPGIMKAKMKPLAVLKATDLLGEVKPKVQWVNFRLPPERKAGKILKGEVGEVVPQLVKLLREEAKVI